MPYLPQGATPAQLDAFAHRLSIHLSPPQSRKGLMSVREAFARAGGFPDSHALDAAIEQDAFWKNPLLALGRKPAHARKVLAVTGIAPHKLHEWSRQSWKKYRPLLSSNRFDGAEARILLSQLWGHESWEDVLRHAVRRPSAGKRLETPGLVFGESVDALAINASSRGRGNFRGLHSILGKTPEGQIVGLHWSGALTHQMLVGEERPRRYGFVNRQLSHRVESGDHLLLLDASCDGSPSHAAKEAMGRSGRRARLVDLSRQCAVLPSWVHLMSVSGLVALLVEWASQDGFDARGSDAVSWLAMAIKRWKVGHRHGEMEAPASLVRALSDPSENETWWKQDVGLSSPSDGISLHAAAQRCHRNLPSGWGRALSHIQAIVGSANTLPEETRLADVFQGGAIFRLPFLLDMENESWARARVAFVLMLWMDFVARRLGRPLDNSLDDVLREPEPLESIPSFCVHVDIPMSWYPKSYAVIPAQSRSLGIANLFVGPNAAFVGLRSEKANALFANVNTKLFQEVVQWPGIDTKGLEASKDQVLVVHRDHVIVLDDP